MFEWKNSREMIVETATSNLPLSKTKQSELKDPQLFSFENALALVFDGSIT